LPHTAGANWNAERNRLLLELLSAQTIEHQQPGESVLSVPQRTVFEPCLSLRPMPRKLVKSLKAWKAKADKTCNLVFPTSGCNPKLDFLDGLKAVAQRAKLDKENFWLHKFVRRSLRGRYGLVSISARFNNGSVARTWNLRSVI
jgi:hypothetical protein